MHEASLMRGLMAKILSLCEAERADRVTKVSVWLGALSHMSAEHFREHYRDAAAGSLAADAELEITVSDDIANANAAYVLLEKVVLDCPTPSSH